jgi:CDGSH-type Zn-finger protein/uncharacterized Fe-S cluster protein YjdI
MKRNVYEYDGDDVTVTWDEERCIHAAACVQGLPNVFDPERRPWIEPDAAEAEAVEDVVLQCPTGALHLTRNGTDPEPTPDENRIALFPNGPLLLKGDIELVDADGETLLTDTRMALCRCGLSENKPLCDGSHDREDGGFEDPGAIAVDLLSSPDDAPETGRLRVQVTDGGPLVVEGPVTIEGSDESCSGHRGALCRCGASASKPFCDGSHSDVDLD